MFPIEIQGILFLEERFSDLQLFVIVEGVRFSYNDDEF